MPKAAPGPTRSSSAGRQVDFEIEYLDSDDGEITRLAYSLTAPTKKQIRDLARREVTRLAALKAEVIDLPVGQSINIDPDIVEPPTPPTPPTQAELDRNAWFADYRQLNQLLEVTTKVPALATAQATTLIANLRVSLEAGWRNSYLGDIE